MNSLSIKGRLSTLQSVHYRRGFGKVRGGGEGEREREGMSLTDGASRGELAELVHAVKHGAILSYIDWRENNTTQCSLLKHPHAMPLLLP